MSKREIIKKIDRPEQIEFAAQWAREMTEKALKAGPVQWSLSRPRRSLSQNALLWPLLTDISKQVEWYGQHMSPEDWKHMLTASLTRQRAVPGIDGGFVVLGLSTSKMSKELFSQLIELIYAFGAERGIKWSGPSNENLYQLRNAA